MNLQTDLLAAFILVALNIMMWAFIWGKMSGRFDNIDERLKIIENCFEVKLKIRKKKGTCIGGENVD